MNNFLPTQCQKYLVESLDKRTTKNLSFELANVLMEYTSLSGTSFSKSKKSDSSINLGTLTSPNQTQQPSIPTSKSGVSNFATGVGSSQEDVEKANKQQSGKFGKQTPPTTTPSPMSGGKTPKTGKPKPVTPQDIGGGFGQGMGEEETDTSKSLKNVLVGSKTKSLIPGGDPMREMLGLYGLGKAAYAGSDILGQLLGDKIMGGVASSLPGGGLFGNIGQALAGKALAGIPGVATGLLKQIGDISGAGWFDANVSRIGRSEMELAAQGAGSPWTPFALPGERTSKPYQYDPNRAQDEAIAAAERAEKIKKLKGSGYNIP